MRKCTRLLSTSALRFYNSAFSAARQTPDGPVNLEQVSAEQAPAAETSEHIPSDQRPQKEKKKVPR